MLPRMWSQPPCRNMAVIQLFPHGSGPRQALSTVHRQNEAWYTAEFMFGSSYKMNTAKLATISKMLTTGNRRAGRPSDNGSISRPPFP